jgi:hypothetical protein
MHAQHLPELAPPVFGLALDPFWAIPVMGAVVCALAFLVGRRLLTARANADAVAAAVKENFLQGVVTERRATPRRRGNAIEAFLSDGQTETVPAWVVDRSMGGLCMLVERSFDPGVQLHVRPRNAPQSAPWTVVVVKACRADGPGQWEIGCQFVQAPTWSVLLLFG